MMDVSVPIYHFGLSVRDGRVEAFVNDFPIAEESAGVGREVSIPVNPYLVGLHNELRLVVHHEHVDGAPQFESSIRRFFKGSIVSPGAGDLIARIESPVESRGPLPWTLRVRFSTLDAPSFGDELLVAAPYEDQHAIIAYALHLRTLVESRQHRALLNELSPKIEAFARAYAEPAQRFEGELAQVIEAELFAGQPDIDFDAQDLELESCCGGRSWGIRRRDGRALLCTKLDSLGSRFQLSVFVGEREGRLRIIR